MDPSRLLTLLLIPLLTSAKQPSAPAASPAPIRELPWGQLNFLHTTDTHGWHGGHLQEPQYSADWGDYVSFISHLRNRTDAAKTDLLLVDTGDRLEGNGLYDGSKPPGQYTYDVFKSAPYDIITVGNHELYINTTAAREYTEMTQLYKNAYLASNLNITSPVTGSNVSFAPRFKKFRTPNQNLTVLAFGFLYNFGKAAPNVQVLSVADTVKEKWFLDALNSGPVDLIVVAGHVQLRTTQWAGQEYILINQTIRSNPATANTPIAFFGGHSHIRDFRKFDDKAYGIQSGRYAETVGFMSISGLGQTRAAEDIVLESSMMKDAALPIFQRRYIDTNLFSFHTHSGRNSTTFDTPLGREITANITADRKKLNLDKPFGCAPQNLSLYQAPYPSNASILTWLETQVFPDTWKPLLNTKGASCANGTGNPILVMSNSGAIRFDIFKGSYTIDSNINLSPFLSGFRCLTAVPAAPASQLVAKLNAGPPILMMDERCSAFDGEACEGTRWVEPALQVSPTRSSKYTQRYDNVADQIPLQNANLPAAQPSLLLGYVTKDDFGSEGDDTLHIPYPTFTPPNVIGASVGAAFPGGMVDVVYNEFMEKPVLEALSNLSGGTYKPTKEMTSVALGGRSLTDVVGSWVGRNWPC